MAFDFNHFTTVCRLTADPEAPRSVGDSKVIKFRVAFTGESKKTESGWEDKPVFLDCEAWQSPKGFGKLVDTIEKYARKGLKVHLSGSFKMDVWDDKNGGGKRQALKLKVQTFTVLDSKGGNAGGDDDDRPRDRKPAADAGGYGQDGGGAYGGGSDDPIPF